MVECRQRTHARTNRRSLTDRQATTTTKNITKRKSGNSIGLTLTSNTHIRARTYTHTHILAHTTFNFRLNKYYRAKAVVFWAQIDYLIATNQTYNEEDTNRRLKEIRE